MHSHELVTTGNGLSVLNNGVKTPVINQDGTLNGGSVIDDGSITLAKLAAGIAPSNVIKFAVLGSKITDTTLTGLAVGDLVIHFIAATSTVTVKPCATINTLPDNPADADYIVVLRVAA